jgi:hypothetical protein
MEIKGIGYRQYDSNGNAWPDNGVYNKRRKKNTQAEKKPINAITFDMLDLSKNIAENDNDIALLSDLVKSFSDDYVRERMNQVKDSYPIIDDFLVEKLIMEAL